MLKPGMNSDVSILVEQRTNALVIPNDAVGSTQDLYQAATALGVDQTTLAQVAGPARGRGGRGGGGGADSTSGQYARGGRAGGGRRGARQARAAAPAPNAAAAGAATSVASSAPGRRAARASAPDTSRGINPATGMDTTTMKPLRIVDSLGGEVASVSDTDVVAGGVASSEPHPAVVLVLQNGKWTPRKVMLGIGNYDVTEVLSGLSAGDKVALVSEIRVQASRDSSLNRIQSRGGLPGIGGGGSGGGNRGGGRRGS
ncbi:MAG TPA: hypothetical protein VHV78_14400, partial [Gemmatimonadaceae bacterium]|jgi:HlyD family secretion protein|nr:hypothetical protein [Gemmatimonadaceae bacterium]